MQLSASEQRCARELLDAFPPVMWFVRRKMRTFRRGLSVVQFRALVFVQSRPHANVSAVAEHLGASMPTTSRVVGVLARRGLIARVGSPKDRRQLELSLTARGRSVLATAWRGTERHLAGELTSLDVRQRQTVCQAMDALKSVFGSIQNGIVSSNGAAISRRRKRKSRV